MNTRRWVGVFGVLLFFGVFASPIRGEDSDDLVRVRAVRLNFIQGEAVLQQEDGKEVDARSHMPLEEGFTLFTLPGGFAEIEFENRSIVRLGEESELYFSQLALHSETGAKVTELLLRRGYATFQVRFEKGGVFEVVTPDARVIPDRSAEFRVDLDSPMTFVKVFDGRVKVLGDAGDLWVEEGQMATIDPQGEQLMTLVNGFDEDEWDVWNEERDRVLVVAAWNTSPTSYSRRTFDDHLDDRCHDEWYHSSFYPYRTSIFFGYPSHHWGYGHHSGLYLSYSSWGGSGLCGWRYPRYYSVYYGYPYYWPYYGSYYGPYYSHYGYHASYFGHSFVYFNNFNHHRHGGFFDGHTGAISEITISVSTMTGADISAEGITILAEPSRLTRMMIMNGTVIVPRAISGTPGGVIEIVKAPIGASPGATVSGAIADGVETAKEGGASIPNRKFY